MTHYEILGVSKTASQEEIKSAYKKLIKKYHPDLYQGDKNYAVKKTQEINVAYDILSDKNKKDDYDSTITYSSTSTNNYSYTPPKYSNNYDPYTSYSNYYQSKYSSKRTENTSNQQYNSFKKANKSEIIYDEFSKKLGANFAVILFVFVIYLIIFIATLIQYKSYKDHHTYNKSTNQPSVTNNYEYKSKTPEKKFNINDYFSDSELLELYNKKYKDSFDSFSEFKEAYSLYVQLYYNF